MPKVFRYVNRNPWPVSVPGPTGGQVLFRPGEGTTESWFGAFCNPRQLTREEVDLSEVPQDRTRAKGTNQIAFPSTPSAPVFPPVPPTSPPPQAVADPSESITITQPVEEETETYVKKRGVYYCKLCDLFRTGSRQLFEAHIREFHAAEMGKTTGTPGEMETLLPGKKVEVPSETQEVTVERAVEQSVEQSVEQPTANEEASQQGSESEQPLQCPYCSKMFRSQGGLRIHIGRVHKDQA